MTQKQSIKELKANRAVFNFIRGADIVEMSLIRMAKGPSYVGPYHARHIDSKSGGISSYYYFEVDGATRFYDLKKEVA